MAAFEIVALLVIGSVLLFASGFVLNNALWTPAPVPEDPPTVPIRMPRRSS
jgi:hypothetical protein